MTHLKPIKLKSLEEVMERFKELVHRHRRRYLKRFLRPCPHNCSQATVVGGRATGCPGCGSTNPDYCKKTEKFTPLYTKLELAEQFRVALRDPKVLLREYRDLVVFLWLTGEFDSEENVPEHIIEKVERHD